ncbi:hypothetical protein DW049_09635 [Ruminococcus sp. AF41-9]|nr:hypothetical protein DW049_09635 [Ruminococcus sp. AF41-9]
MKNAYELAENILKSKPDKNIELKSSDSFASIELYGTSACKKVQDEKYQQIWIDDCTELVGEENAEAAYDKLASMVSGTIYGEEAVEAYKDGDGVYDCSFKEGVNKLEFDGSDSVIKGYDSEGKEIFSHTYHYVGIEEVRGLYEFKSDDADSGEFTYFCIAPDTNDTTYHIELRYGSDLEALGKYDEGDYAYWLGSAQVFQQTMIRQWLRTV